MDIDTPDRNEVDVLADLWVALARGQQEHGSHLAAESNRTPIRESITQHLVTGGLLVARADDAVHRTEFDRVTDVIGFVMFSAQSGRYEETTAAGLIENLYVVPDHRGDGIGSSLLVAAEESLHEQGIETITLDVMTNNAGAQQFYEHHGYTAHRITMAKHETDIHSKDE
ncbi:GNAT family N-acetyltransferase [Halocatena pleomorpha]|uniref:GNAT family N-acetyltransferase n=1 Tax=Halocatena pleomorpha TaxID=1785090 RepID=A0A3P3RGZ2_9EURY|nr:GNAT family N-acetyltransferase [Halocatena pleomorpha]RRJ32807.1 GNAT family N-acetyltransferase [Halocatena pleomorpha]